MRMEAKNAYTKKAASHGNFKNVTLSFAERHQRLLAFQLKKPDIMSPDCLVDQVNYICFNNTLLFCTDPWLTQMSSHVAIHWKRLQQIL